MLPIWWTVFAFFGGGCAGMLLIALMRLAADPAPQSIDGQLVRSDKDILLPTILDPTWAVEAERTSCSR